VERLLRTMKRIRDLDELIGLLGGGRARSALRRAVDWNIVRLVRMEA
jgi:hypothetical protein